VSEKEKKNKTYMNQESQSSRTIEKWDEKEYVRVAFEARGVWRKEHVLISVLKNRPAQRAQTPVGIHTRARAHKYNTATCRDLATMMEQSEMMKM
jgi:hypothetical protein